ncbi:MAG TPA: hypothetical protein VJN96_06695 [Vicinamibacterales bacterium]|nr:hypothetical protein [Vicinamibacterales bacterium]
MKLTVVIGAVVAVAASPPDVTSVRVRVAPKTLPVTVVTFENRGPYMVSNGRVELTGPRGILGSYPRFSPDDPPLQILDARDPLMGLKPGERREVRFVTPDGSVAQSIRVTYVNSVYGDREGDPAILNRLERDRVAGVSRLDYWVRVLDRLPTDENELRTYLKARVQETPSNSLDTTGSYIARLLEGCRTDRLRQDVRAYQDTVMRSLEYLQIPPRQETPGPVTSVTATLEPPATADELVAYVTNDRDVTVEAWDVGIFALPEARFPIKTYTARGGGDPHATASTLPLRPHETRELLVSTWSADEGVVTQPRPVVRLALFEDGRYEGSFEMRQQMLADRARDAIDVEYWLEALKNVRNVAANVTIDALRDRMRTRRCQATGVFHTDRSAPDVAAVAGKIELKPDEKAVLIDQAIAAFEAERLAIQKFVNR